MTSTISKFVPEHLDYVALARHGLSAHSPPVCRAACFETFATDVLKFSQRVVKYSKRAVKYSVCVANILKTAVVKII